MAENPYVPAPNVTLAGPARRRGRHRRKTAELFYLDAELQDPDDLATLRAQGRHYLCYLSAGSVESFRDDAQNFPASAVGNALAELSARALARRARRASCAS